MGMWGHKVLGPLFESENGASLPEDIAVLGNYTRKRWLPSRRTLSESRQDLDPVSLALACNFQAIPAGFNTQMLCPYEVARITTDTFILRYRIFRLPLQGLNFSHILLEVLSAPQDLHMNYEFQK